MAVPHFHNPLNSHLSYHHQAAKAVRVLSIDGGGMRGVIPATILAELEDLLIAETGEASTRLVDYFDFFTGTSTGGILICLYLLPDPQNPTRPRYSAREVLALYTQQGPLIFYRNLKRRLTSMMGFTKDKFDSAQMAKMLRRFMGEAPLSSALKPCLIPAYDISQQAAYCFDSHLAKQKQSSNFPIWQVAQATASAPVYFEPMVVQAQDGSRRTLIDGGIFANNPSLTAYLHLQGNLPSATPIHLLSLGTGCTAKPYQVKDFKAKGILRCWKPLLHVLGTAKKHSTEMQVCTLLKRGSNQYYRLNPKLLGVSSQMDNTSPKQIAGLQQLAREFAQGQDLLLQQIVRSVMVVNSVAV
ncbi:MAG: patatin-like phospholipase family protein [Bacteroidota bacterium]